MKRRELTDQEKCVLISRVAEASIKGAFDLEDMVSILKTCKSACEKRLKETDRETGAMTDLKQ